MDNICFDFSSFHRHGSAFYQFLALRKRVLVDQLGWQVPHDDHVEMDQYDSPLAQYSLVWQDGKVLGGARAMSTTASWGEHTYMLRDALCGKLPHIPPHLMSVDIASPLVWECTRLVMSDEVRTQAERAQCLRLIIDGLVTIARKRGAEELICLSSVFLMRAMRQLGYQVTPLGETYRNDEDGRVYGVLRMPATFSRLRQQADLAVPHAMMDRGLEKVGMAAR